MSEWHDISTAPKDGTWFLIANAADGFDSYEVGRYEPFLTDKYIAVGDNGLYRRDHVQILDWRGFNNFHRATHWMALPAPPGEAA